MQSILIHAASMQNNSIFVSDDWDPFCESWICLRNKLNELGYELRTSDDQPLEDCAYVWFYDSVNVFPYSGIRGTAKWIKILLSGKKLFRNLYKECIHARMQDKMVLFLNEPPSVVPSNLDPNLHKLFPIIFTWHDGLVDNKKFFKIYTYPLAVNYPQVPLIPFEKKKLLINITANKTSHHPHELYTARRETIRHFERNRPNDFDLYGIGWDRPIGIMQKTMPFLQPKYYSYRGTVKNKWDVLPYYRFTLCYENISDIPGYVSEKIFDAMRSGSVPVYWGASNIYNYVDKTAFIDRRNFKTNAELEDYLVNVSELQYMDYRKAILGYLNSELFARFLAPAYAERIIVALGLADRSGRIK